MLRNQENQITYPNPTPSSFYHFPSTRSFPLNAIFNQYILCRWSYIQNCSENWSQEKWWHRCKGMRERDETFYIVLQFKCARITNFEIIRPVYLRFDTLTCFIRWLILYHCTSTCSTISAQITIKMMSQAKHMMQCI